MSFCTLIQGKKTLHFCQWKNPTPRYWSQLLIPHIPNAILYVSFLLISLISPFLLGIFYKLITSFDVRTINPLINQSIASVNKHKLFKYSHSSAIFHFSATFFRKEKKKTFKRVIYIFWLQSIPFHLYFKLVMRGEVIKLLEYLKLYISKVNISLCPSGMWRCLKQDTNRINSEGNIDKYSSQSSDTATLPRL